MTSSSDSGSRGLRASATGAPLEPTVVLLARVRDGDATARDVLVARYLPILRRWSHGRLPGYARSLADTDDLVQMTLIRTLRRLPEFEVRREGAFLAYLRRALLNAVRSEIKRSIRRGEHVELSENVIDETASLVEQSVGQETMARYEAALAVLPEEQQEAVILRIEFGYTHQEIADMLGKPSANTARMIVARGLVRLAKRMEA